MLWVGGLPIGVPLLRRIEASTRQTETIAIGLGNHPLNRDRLRWAKMFAYQTKTIAAKPKLGCDGPR